MSFLFQFNQIGKIFQNPFVGFNLFVPFAQVQLSSRESILFVKSDDFVFLADSAVVGSGAHDYVGNVQTS